MMRNECFNDLKNKHLLKVTKAKAIFLLKMSTMKVNGKENQPF